LAPEVAFFLYEAVRLIEQDPYFQLGRRKGYRLLVWGKAPCYGTVSL